jgi:hypothetical protein
VGGTPADKAEEWLCEVVQYKPDHRFEGCRKPKEAVHVEGVPDGDENEWWCECKGENERTFGSLLQRHKDRVQGEVERDAAIALIAEAESAGAGVGNRRRRRFRRIGASAHRRIGASAHRRIGASAPAPARPDVALAARARPDVRGRTSRSNARGPTSSFRCPRPDVAACAWGDVALVACRVCRS